MQADPGGARHGLVLELVPRRELVGEGERHGDVGQQVDAVPGAVGQAAAHDGRRGRHDGDQQEQPPAAGSTHG